MAGHIWKILRCEISGVRARSTMGKTGLFPRKRIINRRRRRIGRESISMNVLRIALLFPRNLSTHRGNDNL